MLKRPKLPDGFQGRVFIGKIWGEVCRVYDLPLIGWWCSNRWLSFPESQWSAFWFQPVWGPCACVQPEVTILHLGRGLSFSRRTQKYIVMNIPWGGTRILPITALLFLDCSSFFCIPSLPLLVTVWICPLELRKGLGGWSLFPTNKKQGTQKGFCKGESPPWSCSVLIPLFFDTLQSWEEQLLDKRITFWI